MSLQWMNSCTSGCLMLSCPMCAPSRNAPCVSVAPTDEYSFITAMGPQASPCVVAMRSRLGRSLEKPKPMPPPHFSIIAASLATCMMEFILSSGDTTKHADRQPLPPVPAFTSVGEFGRNFSDVIRS